MTNTNTDTNQARVYAPDDSGICRVCGRPEGEHARGAWTRACPPPAVIDQIIAHLRATGRTELIHFAGAAHRDPAARRVIEEYLMTPRASEESLRDRARSRPSPGTIEQLWPGFAAVLRLVAPDPLLGFSPGDIVVGPGQTLADAAATEGAETDRD